MAKARTRTRRRPAASISLPRAARLFQLVHLLAAGPRTRAEVLAALGVGLRTFYREVELLGRLGVKVRLVHKHYTLLSTAPQAEARLPFPDPQLTFTEMRQLTEFAGPVGQRLNALYREVVSLAEGEPTRPKRTRGKPRSS